MTIGKAINAMAGAMVLIGLFMAHLNGQADLSQMSWLWLPTFVGANLFQSAFTGFCPAVNIFRKLGLKEST